MSDQNIRNFVEFMEKIGATKQPIFTYIRTQVGTGIMQKRVPWGFYRYHSIYVETPLYNEELGHMGMGWKIRDSFKGTSMNDCDNCEDAPPSPGIFIRDNGEAIAFHQDASPRNDTVRTPDGTAYDKMNCVFVTRLEDSMQSPLFEGAISEIVLLEYAERAAKNPDWQPPFHYPSN